MTALAQQIVAPPSPYKGLAPFEDSDLDAFLFFGREQETEIICANLMAAPVTILYGPSGVGKTSVLRAGVAHRLRHEEGAEAVVFSSWSGDPVAALISALGGGASVADAVESAAAHTVGDLYLVFDQFEECFLYHRDGGQFARELADVVKRPELRVNILIGIREEALARLDSLKASIPNLMANRLRLGRLSRAAGAAAIVRPVLRYNELVPPGETVSIELELEDRILDEVAVGRVDLGAAGRGVAIRADEDCIEAPYLQLVLARLWDVEARAGSRTLRLETLRALGGAENIVQDHLVRAMAELSTREKAAAAAMYNYLVTPSGTKIAHGVRDLARYARVPERDAAGVLEQLSAERIVRATSSDGAESTTYEIFHDVLAEAVLAWRTKYDTDRRLEEERRVHRARQRRFFVFGAIAALALAVMAGITVYALSERRNANEQTAAAEVQKAEAEQQRTVAQQQATIAQQKTKEAQQAQETAQANEQKANANQQEALAQKARAEDSKRRALRYAALAAGARDRARRQAALAARARDHALRATKLATRRQRLIHARSLDAAARSLVASDPEASVRTALAAVAAYRRAQVPSGVAVEDVLRDGLLALRLKAVLRTGGPVRITRFSPDNTVVLTAGAGGVRLYNRAHGYAVKPLLPASHVVAAAFSPDGKLVAAAGTGADHAAHVWDAASGALLYTLEHDAGVLSVAFSPDGRYIATGSADGTARVWSTAGGLPVTAGFKHDAGKSGDFAVHAVSFSPDSRLLLTVGGNRFARVFDVQHGRPLYALDNTALLYAARFSNDGKLIATAGANDDGRVRIWAPADSTVRPAFMLRGTGRVGALTFSADDSLLATAGGNDAIARIWNLEERSSVGVIAAHRSGVQSAVFSPNGRVVLTAGRDGIAYLAQSDSGAIQGVLAGHRGAINDAAFAADGRLAASAGEDGTVRIWDARVDAVGPLRPATPRELGRHGSGGRASGPVVRMSADGRLVVSAGVDDTADLWRFGHGVVRLQHRGYVGSAEFGRGGTVVITASDDGTAAVWRAADGRRVRTFRNGAPVKIAKFSPDGTRAVTAGPSTGIAVWSVGAGKLVRRLPAAAGTTDVRFSSNGKLLVAVGKGSASVWRVADGRRLAGVTLPTGDVVATAISPDGTHLAAALVDSTARIWALPSGRSHLLTGHTAPVTSLVFNPDGTLLATGGADTDVRVWRVATGAAVAVLRVHSGSVNDVAFSADGRWLATGGPQAAGVWETRVHGNWPLLPIHLVRNTAAARDDNRLDHLAFSGRGWKLALGWRDGTIRTYDCKLCGRVPQLTAVARADLRAIVKR